MSAFATLAGLRIVSGSIAIPLYGMWTGDVSLATDDPIQDSVSLVLGNLTMAGHVYRQADFAGARRCRITAGAGGWRNEVVAKQYSLASGVKLGLILGDAASEVGEKVNVPNDSIVGTGYVRERGPASRVLRQLAGADWYIDSAGVTQIAPWPARKVPTSFSVEDQDGGQGRVTIATEDYVSWMPGCTFTAPTLDGTFANCGVLYKFDGEGKFRLEVLTQ